MSEPSNWAVIDKETNIVINIILWNGVIYSPQTPSGHMVPDGV